jgi:hypothetical protein
VIRDAVIVVELVDVYVGCASSDIVKQAAKMDRLRADRAPS